VLNASALALGALLAISPFVQAPLGSCVTSEVEVTWGFKESFRSYVSGAIAAGSWSTSGEVDYSTPVFSFRGGEGYVTPQRDHGEVSFDGELRFTGHGGILNTVLASPRFALTGPREATLFVDVTGDTMDLVSVSARNVDFATIQWSRADEIIDPEAGIWDVSQAEVVLTEAGAAAFGTYSAGEIFDPMDISFEVAPGCLVQPGTPWWWVAGGVALAATVTLGAVLTRRGRKSPEQEHP
jgi:hypothetical protein